MFGSEPFSSHLRMSNAKQYRYDWIWSKPNGSGFLGAKKRPLKSHEIISVFYDRQPVYNPQMRKGKPYSCKQGYIGEYLSKNSQGVVTNNCGERYPLSVLDYSKETGYHPTQKPVKLLEYLIKTYTNQGETVLDFAMGSGSTGVACVNTDRDFIGIELDEQYYNIAKDRIEKAERMLKWE